MKVRSVLPYDGSGPVRVYDLTVEPCHSYRIGGITVSNSKRISLLDVNALMSHGATEVLRDAGAVRGQRNEDLWLQFMQGHTPYDPRVPFAYEKFMEQLKAAGINVQRNGAKMHVMALTNKDLKTLAGDRYLRSGDTVNFNDDMRPLPGGLFDQQLTGGHGGKRWSMIRLPEPMPNPVMEEPIRRLLGLTRANYDKLISGEHELPRFGTGPAAIAKALDNINLDKELETTRAQVKSGRGSVRDQAVRKLGYLKSAHRLQLHPRDWMLDAVPVLPPAFRPVSMMGTSGLPLVSDPNYLYKEVLEATDNYKSMKGEVGEENVGAERAAIYHAFKAVVGLADPVHPKLQEKGVKGVLKSVFGSSPKFGTVQRKLLSSTVDAVGRSVIVPNPDYDMDTVGIPEDKAFAVYAKPIARRLRRRGMPLREALKSIKDHSPLARDMLLKEMDERPVYLNRAPVLHKWGILGFRPKLVKGDVIQLSPLVVKGFNADFDGDAMQFHVPQTPEAVQQVYDRMLPSKNLLSLGDFKTPWHVPGQEYLGGLHHASTAKNKRGARTFADGESLKKAYARGEVRADEEVVVLRP